MPKQIIERLLYPIRNSKTRIKLRCDTILEKCPKRKTETPISVKELETTVIKKNGRKDAEPITRSN